MGWTGVFSGIATLAVIGIFHNLVLWSEYHFGKRIWPIFAGAGLGAFAFSLFAENPTVASILGIVGAACLWSVGEMFRQHRRVRRGWFPKKPERAAEYEPLPVEADRNDFRSLFKK